MEERMVLENVEYYIEPEQCPVCESYDVSFENKIRSCCSCSMNWIILSADE
jgi:hypothetical protein